MGDVHKETALPEGLLRMGESGKLVLLRLSPRHEAKKTKQLLNSKCIVLFLAPNCINNIVDILLRSTNKYDIDIFPLLKKGFETKAPLRNG